MREERVDIEGKITANPGNRSLKKELQEVNDDIAKIKIELKDEVEIKLTDDERTAHSNAWRTHRDLTECLKTSRGKVYSLLLGQCTQVLVDKMKQYNNWVRDEDKHIVQPKSPTQAHQKVCNQAVGQPAQDRGIDNQAAVNSTVPPRGPSKQCNIL